MSAPASGCSARPMPGADESPFMGGGFGQMGKEKMPPAKPLLIEVVPRMTPARCGLSDYSLLIAGELESAFGIRAAFAVLNSSEPGEIPYPVRHCAPAALLEACSTLSEGEPASLLVHLSGYGYAADGAPADLAQALADVSASGRFRVAVFFHELFAPALPWKSAFWHSRRQKEVVRRIAVTADLLVTNARPSLEWLQQVPHRRSTAPIQFLPIFSQVGEPDHPPAFADREPVAVVFGLGGTRRRAYREMAGLGNTLHALGIEEIWDIGPEIGTPQDFRGIPIKRMGVLPAGQVSQRLSRARFGLLPLIWVWLTKSGVFSAYCAHGAIPVLGRPFPGEIAGLQDGIHLLTPRSAMAAQASGLERCSRAAWRWYQGHRLHSHAAIYAQWLNDPAMGAGSQERVTAAVSGL
jgi:hypothetical protein